MLHFDVLMRHVQSFTRLAVLSFVLIPVGCWQAETGPRQFHVFGEVVYDGQPLFNGRITFVPDTDKGNEGPPGYALVIDGKFDTRKQGGKASISGPIQILITGYGAPDENGNFPEEPAFTDFAAQAEISADQKLTQLSFDVPLQEKTNRRK